MHAQRELNRLAARKAALRSRIRARRAECAAQLAVVLRPLDWLERTRAAWNRALPVARIAAVPLGLLLKRALFPRARLLGALIRWAPLAVRAFRAAR